MLSNAQLQVVASDGRPKPKKGIVHNVYRCVTQDVTVGRSLANLLDSSTRPAPSKFHSYQTFIHATGLYVLLCAIQHVKATQTKRKNLFASKCKILRF